MFLAMIGAKTVHVLSHYAGLSRCHRGSNAQVLAMRFCPQLLAPSEQWIRPADCLGRFDSVVGDRHDPVREDLSGDGGSIPDPSPKTRSTVRRKPATCVVSNMDSRQLLRGRAGDVRTRAVAGSMFEHASSQDACRDMKSSALKTMQLSLGAKQLFCSV
jgi:hypothetical protein